MPVNAPSSLAPYLPPRGRATAAETVRRLKATMFAGAAWMTLALLALGAGTAMLPGSRGGTSLALAVVIAVAVLAMLLYRDQALGLLERWPWLVAIFAVVVAMFPLVDGYASPYNVTAFGAVALGLAIGRPPWELVTAAIVASGMAIASLVQTGPGPGVWTLAIACIGAAVAFGRVARFFHRLVNVEADDDPGEPPVLPMLRPGRMRLRRAELIAGRSREERARDLPRALREVVALLADGEPPKRIARRRGVALSTVENQVADAKRRTESRTDAELVGVCVAAGLLDDT